MVYPASRPSMAVVGLDETGTPPTELCWLDPK